MKNSELKRKAINWLEAQSLICKTRPFSFRPNEVAYEIGGTHTALGSIAQEIVQELEARGVRIRYVKSGNQRFFELI